jgi:hypothetical protein
MGHEVTYWNNWHYCDPITTYIFHFLHPRHDFDLAHYQELIPDHHGGDSIASEAEVDAGTTSESRRSG